MFNATVIAELKTGHAYSDYRRVVQTLAKLKFKSNAEEKLRALVEASDICEGTEACLFVLLVSDNRDSAISSEEIEVLDFMQGDVRLDLMAQEAMFADVMDAVATLKEMGS